MKIQPLPVHPDVLEHEILPTGSKPGTVEVDHEVYLMLCRESSALRQVIDMIRLMDVVPRIRSIAVVADNLADTIHGIAEVE